MSDHTLREIATTIGISKSTAGTDYEKAIDYLKKALKVYR